MREDLDIIVTEAGVFFPDDYRNKKIRRVEITFSQWQSSREVLDAVLGALFDAEIDYKDYDVK